MKQSKITEVYLLSKIRNIVNNTNTYLCYWGFLLVIKRLLDSYKKQREILNSSYTDVSTATVYRIRCTAIALPSS